MNFIACQNRTAYLHALNSPHFKLRRELELHIAKRHQYDEVFHLSGICLVDNTPVDFLVDRKWGGQKLDNGIWLPNWRERLECPHCGLNNRQRALLAATLEVLAERRRSFKNNPTLYMMEQVTPMYRVASERSNLFSCIGSEYLDPRLPSGTFSNGIRHENVEALSFADSSFDVVLSNDVFEHVESPKAAIKEAARALKEGGVMLFSIPFDGSRQFSQQRARLTDGNIKHLLPPVYHGNPLSPEGSLVFTDFGWDFIEEIPQLGFSQCQAELYWSLEYGYLGTTSILFRATK